MIPKSISIGTPSSSTYKMHSNKKCAPLNQKETCLYVTCIYMSLRGQYKQCTTMCTKRHRLFSSFNKEQVANVYASQVLNIKNMYLAFAKDTQTVR